MMKSGAGSTRGSLSKHPSTNGVSSCNSTVLRTYSCPPADHTNTECPAAFSRFIASCAYGRRVFASAVGQTSVWSTSKKTFTGFPPSGSGLGNVQAPDWPEAPQPEALDADLVLLQQPL